MHADIRSLLAVCEQKAFTSADFPKKCSSIIAKAARDVILISTKEVINYLAFFENYRYLNQSGRCEPILINVSETKLFVKGASK